MRLVLFEIDETLVCIRGATLAAVARAVQEVYGVTVRTERYLSMGRSEPQIAHDLLRRAGLGPEMVAARADRWCEALPWALRAELPCHPVEACPGTQALLSALCTRRDVLLGLLTGSLESTAPIKLAAGGLEVETFRIGAYGSDDADRRQLPAIAVMRAEEVLDRSLMQAEVVAVGATPADIRCAHIYGARAVAVATSRYSETELRRYKPERVFPSLADTEQVLAELLK